MAKSSKRDRMECKDPLAQLYSLDFGENVRTSRKAKRWTQDTLAYNLGTEHPRISHFENGLVDARISDVVRIARLLEVEPGELLDFSTRKLADHPEPPDGHAQP